VPRFAIAPLGLTTEGSTKFKLKGWKCYLKKLQWSRSRNFDKLYISFHLGGGNSSWKELWARLIRHKPNPIRGWVCVKMSRAARFVSIVRPGLYWLPAVPWRPLSPTLVNHALYFRPQITPPKSRVIYAVKTGSSNLLRASSVAWFRGAVILKRG